MQNKGDNEKDSNIKKIEKYLRKYTTYKTGIKTLTRQLDYIMPGISASYSVADGTSGTFNIYSDMDKKALDRIEGKRAINLYEDVGRYQVIVESIDDAVSELDGIEKDFVKFRYIQRRTIQQTSIELGYSEKHVFNLRHQVMDKLLISLRGLIDF